VGNNPDLKVLLLHGGPGCTHEYLEACDSYLPAAGVEYYYYDQLGSGRSDQPEDLSLWELDRFIDEVEQVRLALALLRAPNSGHCDKFQAATPRRAFLT
jgi:proline iminopeptidase